VSKRERIIEAEVVTGSARTAEPVSTQRVQEQPGGLRAWRSRNWVRPPGDLEISMEALRRARVRFGIVALLAFLAAAGMGWLAATTEYTLLAAVFVIAAIAAGLVGLVFGAVWRLIGRLAHAQESAP
jgi:hypothetical protein